jgi:hypothetical protein
VPANSADLALSGQQPTLSATDTLRLQRARHYVKYAVGAYGFPLYFLERPLRFFCLTRGWCMGSTDINGDNW